MYQKTQNKNQSKQPRKMIFHMPILYYKNLYEKNHLHLQITPIYRKHTEDLSS